jgi:hypothetical protein
LVQILASGQTSTCFNFISILTKGTEGLFGSFSMLIRNVFLFMAPRYLCKLGKLPKLPIEVLLSEIDGQLGLG